MNRFERRYAIAVLLFVAIALAVSIYRAHAQTSGTSTMSEVNKQLAKNKITEITFEPSDIAELSEIQMARKAKLDELQNEIEKVNTEAGQKIMTILGKYGFKDGDKMSIDAKGHWLGFTKADEEKKP